MLLSIQDLKVAFRMGKGVLAEAVNSAASFGDAALHNPLDAAAMEFGTD